MFDSIYQPLSKFVEEFRRTSLLREKNRHIGFYDEDNKLCARVAFLTKCIILNPKELRWIEGWLFSAPLSRRASTNRQGIGIKLVLFLLDCIMAFKAIFSFRILKHLFDALTQIIF